MAAKGPRENLTLECTEMCIRDRLRWLERTPDKREVDGSSPFRPIKFIWGYSSAGRAPALQAGGQRFDSARLHQLFEP